LPSTYSYPVTAREFSTFNNAYLQVVHECYRSKNQKLNIIDVGAAVGDTFLLIRKNIPAAINKIFCIEGHPFFLKYLEINTGRFPESIIVPAILSDKKEKIKNLVMIHESTASAQGDSFVCALALDDIHLLKTEPIDVLKTDVDGFDGRVLAGSRKLLLQNKPAVIFEFHPGLLRGTGNEILQPFKVLAETGYHTLIWFDKYGVFSHFTTAADTESNNKYAIQCLEEPGMDLHYDVVALPVNSSLDHGALAACKFAKSKSFPY
jgi:FkbM family methyltransferase